MLIVPGVEALYSASEMHRFPEAAHTGMVWPAALPLQGFGAAEIVGSVVARVIGEKPSTRISDAHVLQIFGILNELLIRCSPP
jgi:hypothetical protein